MGCHRAICKDFVFWFSGKCLLPVFLFLTAFLQAKGKERVKGARKVEILMHDFSSAQSVITRKLGEQVYRKR